MSHEESAAAAAAATAGKGRVPAVEQAARILFFFAASGSPSASLTEICQALGIYKSRGHAILKTLADHGLVSRDERTKRYRLGPALVHLSRQALAALDIREVARPYLERLARQAGGTALLGIVSGDNLFVVARQDGNGHLGFTIELGHRFPLTAGAHGKAITAFLPGEAQRKLLARKRLFFHGPPAALDRDRLARELADCRQRGFALDPGDLQPGIRAVAAPVFTGSGEVTGALIVIGTFTAEVVHSHGPLLRNAAREISTAMGAGVPDSFPRAGD